MGMNMKAIQQMQMRMEKIQKELGETIVEGSAGGGVVKATVNGQKEFLGIKIDPSAVDPEDVELLQDMVLAAVNEGIRAAQARAESKMGGIAGGLGGLGLPGM